MAQDPSAVGKRLKELSGLNYRVSGSFKKYLPYALNPDEKILAVTTGMLDDEAWNLAVTDKRLLLIRKPLFSKPILKAISFQQVGVVGCEKAPILKSDLLLVLCENETLHFSSVVFGHTRKIFAIIEEALSSFRANGGGYPDLPDEIIFGCPDDDDDDDRDEPSENSPRSEWYSDWKERLNFFLGRRPSQKEERYYRDLFGGDNECRFNLTMYLSRIKAGPICVHAPPDDYYRVRYEVLHQTGAVLSGVDINPKDRLTTVSMEQLRALASQLKLVRHRAKADLIAALKECSEADLEAVWPITGMDPDDLFLFDNYLLRTN
ncbi:hypothetical protein C4J81_16490 [Deltaproteobacteria bacterium Smac51]|nr:hypothetical protein C4J81_16490 [Deltaproteobacteria bacterium Smac51]